MLAISLVAAAMIAACSNKDDTANDSAASESAVQASATTNEKQPQPAAPTVNEPVQAEQANQQQQNSTPDAGGLMRVHFDDIFTITADGSLSPKVPVDINGVRMGPGVTFGGGVQFGGFALSQVVGHDLGVRRLPNGFVQLVNYYN